MSTITISIDSEFVDLFNKVPLHDLPHHAYTKIGEYLLKKIQQKLTLSAYWNIQLSVGLPIKITLLYDEEKLQKYAVSLEAEPTSLSEQQLAILGNHLLDNCHFSLVDPITPQKAVEVGYQKYVIEGKPKGYYDHACLYRTPQGSRCIIGHCMPEELIDLLHIFDEHLRTVVELLNSPRFRECFKGPDSVFSDIQFYLHDSVEVPLTKEQYIKRVSMLELDTSSFSN